MNCGASLPNCSGNRAGWANEVMRRCVMYFFWPLNLCFFLIQDDYDLESRTILKNMVEELI